MKTRIFLEGKLTYLRPLAMEDLDGNYPNWFDDAEVCSGNAHHRYPYSREYMSSYVQSAQINQTQLVLAVMSKAEGVHIGNVSLQHIDPISRTAEFAIILGEKGFWGKGFGFDCSSVIIQHGFRELNLHRIGLGTFSSNTGMIKLAESLGFRKEGVRRGAIFKNGRYLDIVEYGLLDEEWVIGDGKVESEDKS